MRKTEHRSTWLVLIAHPAHIKSFRIARDRNHNRNCECVIAQCLTWNCDWKSATVHYSICDFNSLSTNKNKTKPTPEKTLIIKLLIESIVADKLGCTISYSFCFWLAVANGSRSNRVCQAKKKTNDTKRHSVAIRQDSFRCAPCRTTQSELTKYSNSNCDQWQGFTWSFVLMYSIALKYIIIRMNFYRFT